MILGREGLFFSFFLLSFCFSLFGMVGSIVSVFPSPRLLLVLSLDLLLVPLFLHVRKVSFCVTRSLFSRPCVVRRSVCCLILAMLGDRWDVIKTLRTGCLLREGHVRWYWDLGLSVWPGWRQRAGTEIFPFIYNPFMCSVCTWLKFTSNLVAGAYKPT